MAHPPPNPPISNTPSSSPPPLRPIIRAPERFNGADDDRRIEQAGRSSTNLTAHASSQSIREAARPTLRKTLRESQGSPNVLKKKDRQPAGSSSLRTRPAAGVSPVPTPQPTASQPASRPASRPSSRPSSPLLPPPPPSRSANDSPAQVFVDAVSDLASSGSSITGKKPGDDSEGDASTSSDLAPSRPSTSTPNIERKGSDGSHASHSSSSAPSRPVSRTASGMLSPMPEVGDPLLSRPSTAVAQSATRPFRRPLDASQRNSSASLSRLSMPRSYRDLGTDYDRYYNPFATRNNSQQDLSTPLPRYNSSSHLLASATDLSNRLSNPFKDERRIFTIGDTEQPTPPGSTTPRPASPPPEKTAAISAATLLLDRGSTPAFITEADPEKAEFYPYMDDRLGAPYAIPLFADQKEDDDDMHMPMWDDDKRYRPSLRDRFSGKNLVNTLGMVFITIGLICVFIVLPIISYTGTSLIRYTAETPLSYFGIYPKPQPWAWVNNNVYPLLQNVRTGLIDPDTPESAMTKTSINGEELVLVFSDEFNEKNRTFYPGDDAYWTGADLWYGATQDLEWYDPDAINTGDGVLYLQLDQFPNHGLDYRSGMLQSWNQMCFKGGMYEVSMSLPGPAGKHAWWPGVWTMGNLGRPGYLATTDGLWPYTYSTCDSGITPNQSMTDGTSRLPGQRLPSCVCRGEDHPTPGTGRGAPEIDIAEVSASWGGQPLGVATQSFQVAPFDIWYYPNYEFMQTPQYEFSYVNTYTGGPYQQAVSTTSMLNNAWYDGQEYQKFAFQYTPGGTKESGITWTIGDVEMMSFDARAIGPNGNIGQRLVSEEPMSMILNLGFSHSWVDIDTAALVFPARLRIDYVRVYQPKDSISVTCDPPGYETTEYIAKHPEPYNNPNLTHWADTGYDWPRNPLTSKCKA